MYESPISIVVGEMQTYWERENEKMVLNAVNKVGVNVDKDELMKALQYDRDQYTKGYEEGKNDILKKLRSELAALPTNTRTNWDGCCPDIECPEIEYVDVSKDRLLSIIDNYISESEEKNERENDEEETEAADKQIGI